MKSSITHKKGRGITRAICEGKISKGVAVADGRAGGLASGSRADVMRNDGETLRKVLIGKAFVVCVSPVMLSERVRVVQAEGWGGGIVRGRVSGTRCVPANADSTQTPSFVRFVRVGSNHGFAKKTAAWLQSAPGRCV